MYREWERNDSGRIGRVNEMLMDVKNTITDNSFTGTEVNRSRAKQQNQTTLLQLQPKKTGQLVTGFLLRNEIKKKILHFEPHNDRLCKLPIKGQFTNLSTISAHKRSY
jgi:hypothetical protein